MKLLYICYFSLREPLVETQVLAYLRQLADDGHQIWFMSFEPGWPDSWSETEKQATKARLAASGIQWIALKYHKRPSLPATMWDIAVGARVARRLARREGLQVIHGRAHVASAMGALARWKKPQKLIFDIRGFNPEEYVDAGRWKAGGLKFQLMKAAERAIVRVANGFVILTDAGREIMFPKAIFQNELGAWSLPDHRPIEVIPCCVNTSGYQKSSEISREQAKHDQGLTGRRVVAYVGALGGWYMTDDMVKAWSIAKQQDPSSFALIFTQSPKEPLIQSLIQAGLEENVDFRVQKVAPSELPERLRAADIALSFIKPSYSKISSSPTKLAEYLASGCVVVSTRKIGDCDAQLSKNNVGVLLDDMTEETIGQALKQAFQMASEPDIETRCRSTVDQLFDLKNVGGKRYKRLYKRLFQSSMDPNSIS
jgi:glycosyltransferase involved in cell wall biosynthesis